MTVESIHSSNMFHDAIYIGEYREIDIPGIMDLFHLSFNERASERWFLWKYEKAPWSSKGYVVTYEAKIIAFYGGIKLPFGFMDKTFWAYQFCDVMTHPQYRARFISKNPVIIRAGELFYEENLMDFAYGFPSIRHARLQSLRLGGEGYKIISQYKKEIREYSVRKKFKVKEGWRYYKERHLNRFFVPDPASLTLLKTGRYLKWRYMDHPEKKYGLLVFERLHITRGYIIFNIADKWFNILEIFSDAKEIGYILLSLEAYVKETANCTGVRIWCHPKDQTVRYLDDLGYSAEEGPPIAFRSINKDSGITKEIFYDRYFYRMGDYDAA